MHAHAHPHTVLDLAARVGALLLGSAAAASEVTTTMRDIARTAGLPEVTADVTYSEIVLADRSPGAAPTTRIENIRGRSFNYGRYIDVTRLVDRFVEGDLDVDQALDEVTQIERGAGRYPWWLTRLAAGVAGASAALIFGGAWLVMAFAFAANMVVDWAFARLGPRGWPVFFLQLLTGAIAVAAAAAATLVDPGVDSSLVVVSVIILMLAGQTSTGAVLDAVMGWNLTAVGRIFEAVMNTVGLVVGIKAGMLIAGRLGVDLNITADVAPEPLPLVVLLGAAALIAIGFGAFAQMSPRVVLAASGLTTLGYLAFNAGLDADLGSLWASAAAALLVGALAAVPARWLKAPSAVFAGIAIIPMLPGVLLYRGLLLTPDDFSGGVALLVQALSTAVLLASGVALGEYLMSVTWRRLHRFESRFVPVFLNPFSRRPKAGRPER